MRAMRKRFSRKQVAIAAAVLLLGPAAVWVVMLQLGWVGSPGEPVEPPFNLSDRISTIHVVEGEDGRPRARFFGWEPGDPELTAEQFYDELVRRQRDLPWYFRVLDVTSVTGVAWVVFGLLGQAVFMGRMIAQWYASERARTSVVPPVFWWLSLLGSSMLMVYFIWRWEIIGFLGQSTGWFIYIRNLWFIYGNGRGE